MTTLGFEALTDLVCKVYLKVYFTFIATKHGTFGLCTSNIKFNYIKIF